MTQDASTLQIVLQIDPTALDFGLFELSLKLHDIDACEMQNGGVQIHVSQDVLVQSVTQGCCLLFF